jgi:hypothetical protein
VSGVVRAILDSPAHPAIPVGDLDVLFQPPLGLI